MALRVSQKTITINQLTEREREEREWGEGPKEKSNNKKRK